MCGLFGWVGKDPKQFNKDKFDKLGIYNIKRGIHSCGVAVDGELFKGVNNVSDYQKFITETSVPTPKTIPVVIGHTRKATTGAWTLANAHPFRVDDGDNFVIGAHNGTLQNTSSIAKKYDINAANKIDSQVLIEILAKGNVEVLSDYKGAAALLIYSTEKPNTMYVFRGESKEYYSSVSTKAERPLYYYQENENSMYISSLVDSLKSIVNEQTEMENNIYEFQTNRLYEITNGKIVNKYIVNRDDVWKDIEQYSNSNTNSRTNSRPTTNRTNSAKEASRKAVNDIEANKKEATNNIYNETIIHNDIEQDIYFENLRYKRTGHLLNGICIFVKELGFIKIALTLDQINKGLKDFKYHDKSIGKSISLDIPTNATLYFFSKGILLKDRIDFVAVTDGSWVDCELGDYSHMAAHPIIDYGRVKTIKESPVKKTNQKIILDNQLYTGIFSPLGSSLTYDIKNGNLIEKIELDELTIPEKTTDFITLYENVDDEFDDTEEDDVFENSITENINAVEDTDLIDSIIEVSTQFDFAIQSSMALEKYRDNSEMAKMILEFSENTNNSFEHIKIGVEELIDELNKQEK